MGPQQQYSSSLRREASDQQVGRDPSMRGGLRQGAMYSGAGPPLSHPYAARPSSRPASSALGNAPFSPRQHLGTSYRDAAMIAAQHGLSAYAPSAAAAAAAATRNLPSRSGANAPNGTSTAPSTLSRNANPFNTVPLHTFLSNSGAERQPSRSGPPPPASRGGGGAPPPSSPGAYHRGRDAPPPHTFAGAEPGPWRDAFEAPANGHHDPASASGPDRPAPGGRPGGGAGGWGGAAGPSAYEVDGRPGTRGGGPQYDMEGRPTTRGGQGRPPSRAQLGLAMTQKPGHVPPLGVAGWAGMLTGSGPRPGSGPESPTRGAGGGGSSGLGNGGGGGGGASPSDSLRRQSLPLPLPPSMSAALAASASALSPTGSAHSPTAAAPLAGSPPRAGVLLAALAPAQPGGPLPYAPAHGHPLPGPGANGLAGTGRLTSIAEAPSPLASPKAGVGGGAPGRKASREVAGHLSTVPGSVDGASDEGFNDGSDLDSYLSNLDQDGSARGIGRNRSRNRSRSTTGTSSHNSASNSRQHSQRALAVPGQQVHHEDAKTAAAAATAALQPKLLAQAAAVKSR